MELILSIGLAGILIAFGGMVYYSLLITVKVLEKRITIIENIVLIVLVISMIFISIYIISSLNILSNMFELIKKRLNELMG